MNRRERLMHTFAGRTVDRPAVCFYEINGFTQNPRDPDKFNIYRDPSWQPLLALAREKSDVLVSTYAQVLDHGRKVDIVPGELSSSSVEEEGNRRIHRTEIRAKDRILRSVMVREADIDTTWVTEPLLKTAEDLRAWLDLPTGTADGEVAVVEALALDREIGDAGCLMLNTDDPLCMIASMFDMGTYTIIALTEQELWREALDKAAAFLEQRVERISRALPGRLWRIVGPEYAGVPYLPPYLFEQYVTRYDHRLVEIIHKNGGYARMHSHGNLKDILDFIAATGCMGLDPIEPPPQGDVDLAYVRKRYGKDLVLFGNLEASDLENLPQPAFRERIRRAIAEGTSGEGRGFVLMPSASPYGRRFSATAMKNYDAMIEEIEKL